MKPMLRAPGYTLLKLIYDGPLSNFAFNFNLRRYTEGAHAAAPFGIQLEVVVGRCRLTPG